VRSTTVRLPDLIPAPAHVIGPTWRRRADTRRALEAVGRLNCLLLPAVRAGSHNNGRKRRNPADTLTDNTRPGSVVHRARQSPTRHEGFLLPERPPAASGSPTSASRWLQCGCVHAAARGSLTRSDGIQAD
jgi:hypothetical protein